MMRLFFILPFALMLTTSCAAELPSGDDGIIRSALASGRPTVVDFGARSCVPCKKMAPILEELAKEYQGRANVIFIDVWQDKEIAGKYRVQMIPTQIFYDKSGKESARHTGFMDKLQIVTELKAAGLR